MYARIDYSVTIAFAIGLHCSTTAKLKYSCLADVSRASATLQRWLNSACVSVSTLARLVSMRNTVAIDCQSAHRPYRF